MTSHYEILFVEDNLADAQLLLHFFKNKNFPAVFRWINDGAEALDYIFKREKYVGSKRPHVILLDLNLPKVDGREILRQIRVNAETSSIPVIILTTSDHEDDLASCYQQGISSFITKPNNLDAFEALIQRLMFVEFPKIGIGSVSQGA
jgi:CheY-like chemotaxis protein